MGSRKIRILGFIFFPRLEKQCNNILPLLSCHRNTSFLADWNKYKVHVCCIYLLLQRWVVPLEMLTGNKVHSFLSGRRMFPPQSREHLFGYLLGEAWHLQRDCNTVKPKEDGGEDVGLHQEPAGTPLSGWSQTPRKVPWVLPTSHPMQTHSNSTRSSDQQKPELVHDVPPWHQLSQVCPNSQPSPKPLCRGSAQPQQCQIQPPACQEHVKVVRRRGAANICAGLISAKELWINQHPSAELFPFRAGKFWLK